MSTWAVGTWAEGTWAAGTWQEDAGPPAASFSLSPGQITATGTVEITATGVDTNWGAEDPFTLVSGPATMVPFSYVNVSPTSASFHIEVTDLGGQILIFDSDSETTIAIRTGGASALSELSSFRSPGQGLRAY